MIRKYITSRTDTPTGSADNLFDGDDSTSAIYKTPNKITTLVYTGNVYKCTYNPAKNGNGNADGDYTVEKVTN